MADTQQQIAELSSKISALQSRLGDLCGEVAELNTIMAPFLARYQSLIWPYYETLANVQREIADRRVAMGDKSAVAPGEARSPLDRFFEDPNVQEQYERAWQGKKATRPTGPLNMSFAPPEIKQIYGEVVGYMHPELTEDKAERERRRQLMVKVDEAYVRRDETSLNAMADMYRDRSYLPGLAPADVLQNLRDRVVMMETAVARIEGQKYDLRYGLIAKMKNYAEQLWAEEKRDLLTELSVEIQRSLDEAQTELASLKQPGE
jgi:hypothetical protein